MASSQSLPAYLPEVEVLRQESSHTHGASSEALLEPSVSAVTAAESSFPNGETPTDTGPPTLSKESVCGIERDNSAPSLHEMPMDEARSSAASALLSTLPDSDLNTDVPSHRFPTKEALENNLSTEFVNLNEQKESTSLEAVEALEGFYKVEAEEENEETLDTGKGFQNSEQSKGEAVQKEQNHDFSASENVEESQNVEKLKLECYKETSENQGMLLDVSVASSTDATVCVEGAELTANIAAAIVDAGNSLETPSSDIVKDNNNISEHGSSLEDDAEHVNQSAMTADSTTSETLQEKIEISHQTTDVVVKCIANHNDIVSKEPFDHNSMSKKNSDMAITDDRAHQNTVPTDQSADEIKEEEDSQEELKGMVIPTHWHPKPCVHISCVGGSMTEEELLPTFSKYGPISSVSFENERHDSALVRYELHLENTEDFLGEVRQATNNTKLGGKTMIVEPFRPDSLLFVGNLTPSIDDSSLQSMFDAHGRIERAFVLRNAEGKSKCYGFVEYSLKSQATAAKAAMGNINMDGRVLRVEWSDCKKVSDMLSTVLFVDRLPRDGSNLDTSLQELFGKFGKIRDSHLAIGIGNQYRGFAFVDFYNSMCADKAHQALDGYNFLGSNIRVSFANPSKSTQSYKSRYGTQAGQTYSGKGGASGSGAIMAPSMRVSPAMPFMQPRFMGASQPGMKGYGIGMQFGGGPYERGPMHGSGIGMLGPGGRTPLLYGNAALRPRMPWAENDMQRMQAASITPSAIVQVATAQAKAREEEARARAEAAKQGLVRSSVPAEFSNADRYQRFYDGAHQQFKQVDPSHAYYQVQRQQSIHHQQASMHQQRPVWNQQQAAQIPQAHYHQRPSQNYSQQHQQHYIQQQQQHQQYGYSQYGQQQAYQYGQQGNILYNTQTPQYAGQQQYQQQQGVYPQQNYGEQFAQVQAQTQTQSQPQAQAQSLQPTYSGAPASIASSGTVSLSQDATQQQSYAAYYQQQVQTTQPAASVATATAAATDQQSYEAQWAAYYASQAAYQQQTPAVDVGQKRTAEQMESYQQNQTAYSYAAYPQDATTYQQQQQAQSMATSFQQPVDNVTSSYQQQTTITNNIQYQQQQVYQQASTQYPQQVQASTVQAGYEQPLITSTTDTYQQQATEPSQQAGPAGVYDYSKRPRY